MATKKQRKRRQKERRHEYEFVYVDETGEEVPLDESDETAKPKPKAAKAEARKPASKGATAERKIDPPSWNRSLRRGALFAPFILLFVYLTSKDKASYAYVLQGLLLVVMMPLVMYGMDSMLYRSYQKRIEKRGGSSSKSK